MLPNILIVGYWLALLALTTATCLMTLVVQLVLVSVPLFDAMAVWINLYMLPHLEL